MLFLKHLAMKNTSCHFYWSWVYYMYFQFLKTNIFRIPIQQSFFIFRIWLYRRNEQVDFICSKSRGCGWWNNGNVSPWWLWKPDLLNYTPRYIHVILVVSHENNIPNKPALEASPPFKTFPAIQIQTDVYTQTNADREAWPKDLTGWWSSAFHDA